MRDYGKPLPELGLAKTWVPPFKLSMPAERVDPVTYEIVRHRLWYAGMTIGETLRKVSGTIVVSEAQDFSTFITLADGAPAFLGPYVLLHAGIASLIIDGTLKVMTQNDKIKPGDMYFLNDPWMGVVHQPDCAVISPFFVGKELIAWCGVVVHQLDMGGVDPGGVSPHAKDAYGEPTIYPAVRIVERGRMRSDIDRLLRRNSRLPDILALDVRSMIAANRAAQNQMTEVVKRYGVSTVQTVMSKMLWDSYMAFAERLDSLARGTFRARDFFEGGGYLPEHADELYEVDLAVTNDGERLHFDFSGTSPQANGFVNCGFGGALGGILGALLPVLAPDIPWNGGILARLEITSQEGTINNPIWPAAVSGGVTEGSISTGTVTAGALGHMIQCSPAASAKLPPPSGSVFMGSTFGGVDVEGKFWGTLIMDPIGMAANASSNADGVDLCGSGAIPFTRFANVESAEHSYPMLYLYRRMGRDAFGYGRHCGGRAIEFAFKIHDVDFAALLLWCHGAEFPNVIGMSGGGPSSAARFGITGDTDIEKLWASAQLPTSDDFDFQALVAKKELFLTPDDVIVFTIPGGGGYGDPLSRDPQLVAEDTISGKLSPKLASDWFGVVVTQEGTVDLEATKRQREQLCLRRLQEAKVVGNKNEIKDASFTNPKSKGAPVLNIGDGLSIKLQPDTETLVWACQKCGFQYGPIEDNPFYHAALRHGHINELGHPMGQMVHLDQPRFIMREFFCPNCALRIALDIARPDIDPVIHAAQLDEGWVMEHFVSKVATLKAPAITTTTDGVR